MNTEDSVPTPPVVADDTTCRAFTNVSSSSSSTTPASSSTWANTARREFGNGGKRADDQVSTSLPMSTCLPTPSPQTLSPSQTISTPSPHHAQPHHDVDVLTTPTATLPCSSLPRPQDLQSSTAAAAPLQVPSGPIFEFDLASCDAHLTEVCDDSPVFDLQTSSNKQVLGWLASIFFPNFVAAADYLPISVWPQAGSESSNAEQPFQMLKDLIFNHKFWCPRRSRK